MPVIRSDGTATEDDNIIVQGVEGDKYALGYLPYAYYEPNKDKLKALKIDWKPDDEVGPIAPSPETVTAGTYNPLSRPLFIYVNVERMNQPQVETFVDYYLQHAGDLAKQVQYVELPDAIYGAAQKHFDEGHSGSHYYDESGEAVHGTLETLFVEDARHSS